MSYAIIRNTKYKRDNLKEIFRHNERRNKNYSNDNIDKEKSYLNYSLKKPQYSYEKEFDRIREEYNLKGQIKTVSNIACEYIITSDKEFFERIGEKETKRYFEVAYQFVCEYKNLGKQYILSAKVHMDEQTPHMHLVFLPVVHTKDKKENNIDKLACSEFWKVKDSYRQLQNAFYDYMVSYNFELERGLPKEETGRQNIDLKEYKEITNFKNTKETLKNIKLELPGVPDIKDIRKVMINRDEKICNEIIKPKDELIQELYKDNISLHKELSKQAKVVEEAEKYQNERVKIFADNEELHNTVKYLEKEYKKKSNNLDFDFNNRKDELEEEYKEKSFELEHKYHNKINKLEKENNYLHKIINKFWYTLEKFISWICKKFDIAEEDNLVGETRIRKNRFKYIKEKGCYVCPETGVILEYSGRIDRNGYKYYSNKENCKGCPDKEGCTNQKEYRTISRHIYEELNEEMRERRLSERGRELYKQRKEKVKRSFADSKNNHAYRYAMYRGIEKNQNYTWLICAEQNMKNIAIKKEKNGAVKKVPKKKEI